MGSHDTFRKEREDAEEGQTVFAFEEDEVRAEHVGGGEHDGGAVGDEFAPVGTLGRINWTSD